MYKRQMVVHVCVTVVDDVDSGWLMMVVHVCVTVVDDVDSGWLMMVAHVCVTVVTVLQCRCYNAAPPPVHHHLRVQTSVAV